MNLLFGLSHTPCVHSTLNLWLHCFVSDLLPKLGEVAVVTGGARGIGVEVVKKLLQCGMHVVIGMKYYYSWNEIYIFIQLILCREHARESKNLLSSYTCKNRHYDVLFNIAWNKLMLQDIKKDLKVETLQEKVVKLKVSAMGMCYIWTKMESLWGQ
jgi:hypothetical protein